MNTALGLVFGLGLGAAACAVVLNGQAPEKTPAFEVASIRENVSISDGASVRAQPGGRVSVTNNTLRNIIRNAYSVNCAAIFAAAKAKGEAPPPTTNDRPTCGTRITRGTMMTTGVTIADVARNLGPFTGRPVVDKTELAGAYDVDLIWTPEQGPPGPDGTAPSAQPSSDGESLFTAVQEQLGLKLDAQRGPVDVLVIDSAQRPIED